MPLQSPRSERRCAAPARRRRDDERLPLSWSIPARAVLAALAIHTLWGGTGKYVFLLVGVATLFSTQLTLIDGVARSCADILHGHFAWARRASRNDWYARIAAAWIRITSYNVCYTKLLRDQIQMEKRV